jgi:hypothetical protein
MTDHQAPSTTDPTCDEVRESVELIAVDALDPAERDRLLRHVDGCEGCRVALDEARETVASLLLVVPAASAPDGFSDRVVAAAFPAAPAVDAEPSSGQIRRPAGVRRLVGLAAACVVIALVVTALGIALGTVFASNERAAGPGTTTTVGAPSSAALVTASGAEVGTVTIDDGDDPTLAMAVDLVLPGVPYDCVVRTESGDLVTVGSWTPTSAGSAHWTVALDPSIGELSEVRLVGPADTTLATARFA